MSLLALSDWLVNHQHCGAIPEADYTPGALSIICPTCALSYTAPDMEIEIAMAGWVNLTEK